MFATAGERLMPSAHLSLLISVAVLAGVAISGPPTDADLAGHRAAARAYLHMATGTDMPRHCDQ